MKRPLQWSLALAAGALALLAGVGTVTGDDWLPISPADLALKDNPAQPGADAMILYRNSHVDEKRTAIDGGFEEEYIRIKVFTSKGAQEETNVEIAFLKEYSEVRDIRARTIRPGGSVVKFDGKAFDKTVERRNGSRFEAKVFSLPDVQPGCIIEYKYRQQFKPRFFMEEQWIVSRRLFTRDASFSIVPYPGSWGGNSVFDPTLYFRTTGLPAGSLPQKQGDGSYAMEVHNIPGIEDEPLMPPARALEVRVEFFHRAKGQPVGETTEQYWNRMGKGWSDELDKFLNKKSVLEGELAQTIAASDTPEVKLRKIYARAQKIRDLSYEPAKTATEKKAENIQADANVEQVLQRNYATGRQVNWTFIGLTRAAGFEAFEVYLVQRNRDVFRPSGQDTSSLTADVVWVRAGGKEYWLDPASLYYPFGLIPWYETESKGMRVTKQGAEFIETPAASSADAKEARIAELELKADGSASGKLEVDFAGGMAAIQRTLHRRDDETGRKKAFEKEIQSRLQSGATYEVTNIANWEDTSQPLRVEGTVTFPVLGSAAGHRMIVPLSLFQSNFRKSFEPERRVNPVHFSYRFEETDDVKMRAPAGYKVETLPPKKVVDPGTAMRYEIAPSQHGDAVEVKRRFTLSDVNYTADSYAALRAFFNRMRSSDEAQVVLQSAETAKKRLVRAWQSPRGCCRWPFLLRRGETTGCRYRRRTWRSRTIPRSRARTP